MRAEVPCRAAALRHNPKLCRSRKTEIVADSRESLVHLRQARNEGGAMFRLESKLLSGLRGLSSQKRMNGFSRWLCEGVEASNSMT